MTRYLFNWFVLILSGLTIATVLVYAPTVVEVGAVGVIIWLIAKWRTL